MNGFNDLLLPPRLSQSEFSLLQKGQIYAPVNESEIADPSATILFGEKSDNNVFYLDITVSNLGFLANLDESRHGIKDLATSASGANYGMGDGSVTFLQFGSDTSPLNMWGTTEVWRNNAAICRPRR